MLMVAMKTVNNVFQLVRDGVRSINYRHSLKVDGRLFTEIFTQNPNEGTVLGIRKSNLIMEVIKGEEQPENTRLNETFSFGTR